jgi:hypothetical protein
MERIEEIRESVKAFEDALGCNDLQILKAVEYNFNRHSLAYITYLLEQLTALDQLRWRDVEKELPEDGERVIATDGDFVGEMYLYNSEWARDGWFWELNKHTKIIAWLPLPQAPEVKK